MPPSLKFPADLITFPVVNSMSHFLSILMGKKQFINLSCSFRYIIAFLQSSSSSLPPRFAQLLLALQTHSLLNHSSLPQDSPNTSHSFLTPSSTEVFPCLLHPKIYRSSRYPSLKQSYVGHFIFPSSILSLAFLIILHFKDIWRKRRSKNRNITCERPKPRKTL